MIEINNNDINNNGNNKSFGNNKKIIILNFFKTFINLLDIKSKMYK